MPEAPSEPSSPRSGGCQCGAVRYTVARLGRASICHCRMCQKAFGNAFAPLVTAHGLAWVTGAPSYFRSSNKVARGFCAQCGTPLSYEFDGFPPEVSIASLDHPEAVAPVLQVGLGSKLPWTDDLPGLPTRSAEEEATVAPYFAHIVSRQHPDT